VDLGRGAALPALPRLGGDRRVILGTGAQYRGGDLAGAVRWAGGRGAP
jgi:hypothetical protein